MQVSIARPSGTEIKNCKLFVANLPLNYSQPEVMGLFNQFGRIIECRVLMDASTGLSRCKAFVQFDTRTEAAKALALNSMTLDGGKRPLVVKFAENHSKRTGQMPVAGPGGMGVNGPRMLFPMGGGGGGPGGPQTLRPIVAGGAAAAAWAAAAWAASAWAVAATAAAA